jgi:hypothetical protein
MSHHDVFGHTNSVEGDFVPVERHEGVPLLSARFEVIKNESADKSSLETFPIFFDSDQYREHCFKETEKAWIYEFDQKKIIQSLRGELTNKNFSYLRQVRKFGSVLINVHKFVNITHLPPQTLKKFIYELGQHNDHYQLSIRQEIASRILSTQSTWDDFASARQIVYADKKDFQRYSKQVLEHVVSSFNRPELPVKDFHSLRKEVRQFANLVQTPAAEHMSEGPHWLYFKLNELSGILGKKHDELVERYLSKDEYSSTIIPIQESWVKKFQEILPYIEKIIGLDAGDK